MSGGRGAGTAWGWLGAALLVVVAVAVIIVGGMGAYCTDYAVTVEVKSVCMTGLDYSDGVLSVAALVFAGYALSRFLAKRRQADEDSV